MAKILLGVTGSVAALRTPALFAALSDAGHDVRIVATEPSLYFFDATELAAALIRDADEWPDPSFNRGDPVRHIELVKWADLFAIAPLDANTLAKLALGLADNCLTCAARAWSVDRPLLLAPAMNTMMWEHPVTARHLQQIAIDRGKHFRLVGPIVKGLACGDIGQGGMAEVPQIVAAVREFISPGRT